MKEQQLLSTSPSDTDFYQQVQELLASQQRVINDRRKDVEYAERVLEREELRLKEIISLALHSIDDPFIEVYVDAWDYRALKQRDKDPKAIAAALMLLLEKNIYPTKDKPWEALCKKAFRTVDPFTFACDHSRYSGYTCNGSTCWFTLPTV